MTSGQRLLHGFIALILTTTVAASARQLASRPVDDWSARLERPERVAGLKIDYIIASLGLMVALTWHEGGRLVNARCHASGAT